MLANGHVCILKPWLTIAFLIFFIIYWLKWCNLCISCRIRECACAAASFSLAGKFLIHIVVVASLQVKVLWWKVFELTERLRAMMCNNKSVQLFGSFLNRLLKTERKFCSVGIRNSNSLYLIVTYSQGDLQWNLKLWTPYKLFIGSKFCSTIKFIVWFTADECPPSWIYLST